MLVQEKVKQELALPSSYRFVTGRGRYVDDIKFDNMLFLKVLRSPYARARILKIEGGINGHELNASMSSVGEGAVSGKKGVIYPVLATEYVSYVGQPVAAVLGLDKYDAEDKLDEINVDYEPLSPVIDPLKAEQSEPIHPSLDSNIMSESKIGKDFEIRSGLIIEKDLSCERIIPNPIEPRGIVAYFDGSKLNVYASTQSVHSWKQGISQALRLSQDQVRVIQMDTGGAFGSKGGIYPEYIIACYASLKTKKPVKWIETRLEHLQATGHGRGVYAHMKLYARKDGRVTGLKSKIVVDAGAFPVGTGPWSPGWIGYQITGPYSIKNLYVEGKAVYTNKVPLGPYRGAGRPEASFFIERMMDFLAYELNKDPLEVRLINCSSGKWKGPTGLEINDAKGFLRDASQKLGYPKLKKKKKIGISFFVLIPALEPGESSRVRVKEGKVTVWLGGSTHGQGHDEFARKIVSEELGVPIELVYFENTDTNELNQGVGSWGSRSALLAGAAVVEACRKIKEKARSKLGKNYKIEEFLNSEFDETVFFKPHGQLNSLGFNLAVASKDELGFAKVSEIRAYYDVGRVLNENMVISQIIGGSIQGLGQVLTERATYDDNGQLLVGSIAEAGLLKITAVPSFVIRLKTEKSSFPSGAKGVGESPTIGVPSASVSALEKLTGKRYTSTPIGYDELFVGG